MNILKLGIATIAICSALTAGVTDITVDVGGINIQTCVNTPGGCSQVVNAIGDIVAIDTKNLKINELGSITAKQELDLQLPTQNGTYTSYSFKPAVGELAGKTIYLIFDNVAQQRGKKDFGKNIVKMYRQVEGDKADQWVEVGTVSSRTVKASYPFELDQNGVLSTRNQKDLSAVSINLGVKDVNKAA